MVAGAFGLYNIEKWIASNVVMACMATYPHVVVRTIMHDDRA